jgi:N-acetylglucosamine kinase-like BadF-type ATPase
MKKLKGINGMTPYFLGLDVGSTKTHALVSDEAGRALGFGESGPGNHEVVGYHGLEQSLRAAAGGAIASAGIAKSQIAGAGFGVSGYDWPSEREPTLQAIASLDLSCPVEAVNDAILGLLAGSAEGWGIAVVSGSGCNCRGWDREHRREGLVTGHGLRMGEAAGASELVAKAIQAVAHEWSRRGPATTLSTAFMELTGSDSLAELLEGLIESTKRLDASAAPVVFRVAESGDPVAAGLIEWAGRELGELANGVIRQLGFESLEFDVVLVGSMFNGGPSLVEPMRQTILACAPGARLVRLTAPPVTGAVLLGIEAAGFQISAGARRALAEVGIE